MTSAQREFDIVVYGATGFTGALTARYLAERGQQRWAIGGRDRAKLDKAAGELELAGSRPALLEADSGDLPALRALAERTRVVATTVGPFDRHGDALVAACVEAGADYLDITGEPAFVRRMVDRHHEVAREKGLRIVNCCGFDSVPHDLGAWLAVRQLPDDRPITVEAFVDAEGQVSGGTWHSAINAFANPRRSAVATGGLRPGAGRQVRDLRPWPHYEPKMATWVAPMPTIDPWIVLRSAASSPEYGPDFRYGHHLCVGSLPKLVTGMAAVGGMVALAQLGPTRRWLLGKIPQGRGPTPEKRARSRFSVDFFGRSADGPKTHVRVAGGDPGYTETSKMLAEAACCLVHDRERLPDHHGVLTPKLGLGQPYLDRLRAAGLRFEVVAA